jgi:DNA invertase Pin-like site-specific DNA recombinase
MSVPSQKSPQLAFSYLRFSSDAQADGDSVRRQTALRDAWLARNPNVRLDTSLTLEDRGVSGFRGKHRADARHALGLFLDLVKRGHIPKGSYLIVENLDRLTREDPAESIPMVLDLTKAGIQVVQLSPVEVVYGGKMDPSRLMAMLWELHRGHAESARKAELSGQAWAEKKRLAREYGTPRGRAVPHWLELADGKYRVKPDARRAIKRIFRLAAEGLSTKSIACRLNADGTPPIGKSGRWVRSYVNLILHSRSVLGEYQPRLGRAQREMDGDPIPNYYPAVVTEAEWATAHASIGRLTRPGRRAPKSRHVLSGLLTDALDGCPMYLHTQRRRLYVISADRFEKREGAAPWRPFPLEVLTKAVLSRLVELRADELFGDPGAAKVAECTARLAEVDRRLAVALARFEEDPESPTWSAQVSRYDRERRAVVRELSDARQEAASPLSASWAEAVELMATREPDRLRAALRRCVEGITVLVVRRDRGRTAAVQVNFRGGAVSHYLIEWSPGHQLPRSVAHDKTEARSFTTSPGHLGLDLRDSGQARRLAELIGVDNGLISAAVKGDLLVTAWLLGTRYDDSTPIADLKELLAAVEARLATLATAG